MSVHAISADFESEFGHDAEALTAAAGASAPIESNVTSPVYAPGHGAVEAAVTPVKDVETAVVDTAPAAK